MAPDFLTEIGDRITAFGRRRLHERQEPARLAHPHIWLDYIRRSGGKHPDIAKTTPFGVVLELVAGLEPATC